MSKLTVPSTSEKAGDRPRPIVVTENGNTLSDKAKRPRFLLKGDSMRLMLTMFHSGQHCQTDGREAIVDFSPQVGHLIHACNKSCRLRRPFRGRNITLRHSPRANGSRE